MERAAREGAATAVPGPGIRDNISPHTPPPRRTVANRSSRCSSFPGHLASLASSSGLPGWEHTDRFPGARLKLLAHLTCSFKALLEARCHNPDHQESADATVMGDCSGGSLGTALCCGALGLGGSRDVAGCGSSTHIYHCQGKTSLGSGATALP